MSERGDLSAYLAAGLLLPLLLLIAGGGATTLGLLSDRQEVIASSYGALRQIEVQGGLTPTLTLSIQSDLRQEIPRLAGVHVYGTPAGTPWGQPVCIYVQADEWISLPLRPPIDVQLGGRFCGVSDLPPSP